MKKQIIKKWMLTVFVAVAFVAVAIAAVFLAEGKIAFAEECEMAAEATEITQDNNLVNWVEINLEKIMTAGGGIVGIIAVYLINGLKKKATATAVSGITVNNEIKSQAKTILDVVEKVKEYESKFDSIIDKIDTLAAEAISSSTDDKLNAVANILYKAYMHSGLDETVKSSIEGVYNSITADDTVYQAQIKQLEDTVAALNAQLAELK